MFTTPDFVLGLYLQAIPNDNVVLVPDRLIRYRFH